MSRRQPWEPQTARLPPVFDGARVKSRRLELGLTTEDLAREVVVSLRTIQRWQDGENAPYGAQLLALARVLNLDPEDLYFEPDDAPAAA